MIQSFNDRILFSYHLHFTQFPPLPPQFADHLTTSSASPPVYRLARSPERSLHQPKPNSFIQHVNIICIYHAHSPKQHNNSDAYPVLKLIMSFPPRIRSSGPPIAGCVSECGCAWVFECVCLWVFECLSERVCLGVWVCRCVCVSGCGRGREAVSDRIYLGVVSISTDTGPLPSNKGLFHLHDPS